MIGTKEILQNILISKLTDSLKDKASVPSMAVENYISEHLSDPDSITKILEDGDLGDLVDKDPQETLKQLKSAGVEFAPGTLENIMLEGVVPVAGDVAKGIGTYYAAKNGMLANSLQAMANTSASNSQKKYYGPTISDISAATAAPALGFKAAAYKSIGDLVSNRLNKITDDLKNQNEKKRLMEYEATVSPHGDLYRSYSKLS